MKRTMVVGGVASFIAETATKKLARWGFAVDARLHVEMDKAMTRHALVPRNTVDVVIVFSDMIPTQKIATQWKNAAHVVGVPCLVLTRKESHWAEELKAQGYEPINPNTAAAVAEVEAEVEEVSTKTSEPLALPAPKTQEKPQGFDDLMTQLEVLLSELRDSGLRELTWTRERGLDYEAEIVVRRHRKV